MLNPEQQRAVEHGEGPLLIIAGPGSGKTRVITERIVYLLKHVPALEPQNVLALTYTEKAAAEMLARVGKALPGLDKLPRIFTFHAFCFHVLAQSRFERVLLDDVDVWIFLRRRMEHLHLESYRKLAEPGAFLHDLNAFFSRCQDELVEPDDFEAYVEKMEQEFGRGKQRAVLNSDGRSRVNALDGSGRGNRLGGGNSRARGGRLTGVPQVTPGLSWDDLKGAEEVQKKKELARVFCSSRLLIEQAGCCNFGSLVSETLRLWEREPEALERCRALYRYILVDEFQDTNFGQIELLRRLVLAPHNITAVGDDDQAIYRFRGASHGQFRMFDGIFPDHETVYLDRNYRSTKRILRAASVLIGRNERYENKHALRTEAPEGEKVVLVHAPDYVSEAAWTADEVERLVKRGRAFGEIAILYRAHGYRDRAVEEFRRRRIPFCIRGLSILSSPIIRDIVAYLNVIYSPHDNVSLTRVLLAAHWRFPEDLALEVRREASRNRCSIFSAGEAKERDFFGEDLKRTGWPELKALLREFKAISEYVPVSALFDRLAKRLQLMFAPNNPEAALVKTFREFLKRWEEKSETRKLAEFLEYFRYFAEAGGVIESPEAVEANGTQAGAPKALHKSAVQMMSVHAAKGLEFPVVFLVGVAARRFPHSEQKPVIEFPDELRKGPSPPADVHLQEERRLFYVALTRARERLYVSSVAPTERKRSEFIRDLLSDAVVCARDIEQIQAPVVELPSRNVRLTTVHGTGCAHAATTHAPEQQESQLHLFASATDPAGSASKFVRPDLETWVRNPSLDGLVSPAGKLRLSATAIESYRECPLKFKFSYCCRIPTGPQAALTFGSIMHQSVRYYFELRKQKLPCFEEVREYYLRGWKGLGFEDSYQEEIYKEAGLEQLRDFVDRHNALAIDAEGTASEQSFSLDLGDVVLDGRIDQINRGNQANAARFAAPGPAAPLSEVELIDYKTGRPRSQKEADKSLQLSVYALAARRQLQVNATRLTFYNLTTNQTVSTVRLPRDLEKTVEIVREVAAKIRALEFDPRPGFGCKYCAFVPVCPAHEEMPLSL